jgi:hypothetical protein
MSPDTKNPTQLDELWAAGTTVNAAAVTRVIRRACAIRRRIASENSPTARVTGTETAKTTTPMAVTATGRCRATAARRHPRRPTPTPDERSLVPATTVSTSADSAATTMNTTPRTRGPLRAQDLRSLAASSPISRERRGRPCSAEGRRRRPTTDLVGVLSPSADTASPTGAR